MYSENSIRSFRWLSAAGMVVLSLLLFATPILAQGTKASRQVSASISAIPVSESEAISESRLAALLEAQLRAQRLEIDLLKDRVRTLEAIVETLRAGQSDPAVRSVVATAATGNVATTGTGLHEEATAAGSAPKSGSSSPYEPVRELLPDIGQVGAEFGLLLGGSTNPFQASNGSSFGGFIDLPLKKIPVRGGKLSYEIMINLQRDVTNNVPVTSGVFALVNFATCGALSGPGCLPITLNTQQRMTVLTVVPFSLKYTVTKFDAHRFRPYGVVGWGTYVTISSQNTTGGIGSSSALLNTLLNGPLIGGLAPEAPELRAVGLPNGQGDIRFGVNFGGGFEYRVTPKFSLGFEYRANKIEGRNGFFSSFQARPALHF